MPSYIPRIPEIQDPRLDDIFLRQAYQKSLVLPATAPALNNKSSKFLEGKLIIEVACGMGYGAMILADLYPNSQIIGLDIDPRAIELAKKERKRPNLEFRVGDVYKVGDEFANQAGGVVSKYSMHHFDDLDRAVSQIYSALIQNGIFEFVDFDRSHVARDLNFLNVISLRESLGDKAFADLVVGKKDLAVSFLTLFSHLASYTKPELAAAIWNAGFSQFGITEDAQNKILKGTATK